MLRTRDVFAWRMSGGKVQSSFIAKKNTIRIAALARRRCIHVRTNHLYSRESGPDVQEFRITIIKRRQCNGYSY